MYGAVKIEQAGALLVMIISWPQRYCLRALLAAVSSTESSIESMDRLVLIHVPRGFR